MAGYAIATGAAAAGVLLRLALDPIWGGRLPLILFFPAVMVSAWFGGLWAGLVTTLLCGLAADYFWMTPYHSFLLSDLGEAVGLLTFAVVGALISGLNDAWRRAATRVVLSEEGLQATLSSIGDGVIATDAQGRVTRLNPVAQALTGWTEAEARGKPLEEVFVIVNQTTRRPAENPVHRVLGEGVIAGLANHTLLVAKNGREIPIDDSAAPIKDAEGRLRGCVLIFRDITDRRHQEEALRASKAELEAKITELGTLVDILPAGVLMADPRCEHITGNRAICDALGIAYGGNISLTAQIPDLPAGTRVMRDRRELSPDEFPMQATGRTGKRIENFEHDLVFPDGRSVTLLASTAPLLDDTGAVRGVLGAYRDITERKQAERALQEADRRKDEFLAMLSHELRNPLGAIVNAAQLLKQLGPPEGNARWARDVIDRQAAHLARIVEDLLDVSRISRGQIVLRKDPIPLASAVALAFETARPLFEARRQTFTSSLGSDPIWVDGDVTRLAQVIGNLLSNASRYSPQRAAISLALSREGGEAVVRVRDNGIGIAAEMLPRVFDLFVQGEPSRARTPGGLGVGLTLARRLTEMHGGRLEAHSTGLGQGSEFVLVLPTLPGEPPMTAVAAAPVTVYDAVRRRILLVDDNPDSGEALALALSIAGHEVRVAVDGPSALAEVEQFQPEVALLDIGLPGMDGFEVARRLKARTGRGVIVLVALTGYGQEEDRRRGKESGFDHYLVKPATPEAILAILSPTPRNPSDGAPAIEH